MKKLILILLISTKYLLSQNITLNKDTILIGEQVILTIKNTAESTNIWPSYKDTLITGIEIVDYGKIDTTNNIITQNITLTSWDTGIYYIPSIEFSENNTTQSLSLIVKSIFLEENATYKDIKQPLDAPMNIYDILPWIIILIIVLFIIYLSKKYLAKNNSTQKRIKKEIKTPPHVKALEKLDLLEKKQLWQKGEVKEYHAQISEIIRRYIEERFKFIALELTTSEIINRLNNKVNKQENINIKNVLERADLAKFAKSKPTNDENIDSMSMVKDFIQITKQESNSG